MARSSTLSFITEVPLKVDSKQESELLARFQAGRQLYNTCLNEAMKRLELVRNSELYQTARRLSKANRTYATVTSDRYRTYALTKNISVAKS